MNKQRLLEIEAEKRREKAQIFQKMVDLPQIKLFEPTEDAPYGSFTGYASVFGNVDRANEVVMPGAYKKTISKFLEDGFIANGHSWGELPIAYPVKAVEDSVGLLITANFHSTQAGQDARAYVTERLAAGKSVKMSIGYRVLEAEEPNNGPRLLKELELYECSIVTVPANDAAHVTGVKGFEDKEENQDDDGDFDSELASAPVEKHFSQVRATNEAFLNRLDQIKSLRKKEGRTQSSVNITRIGQIRAYARQLEQLCDDLEGASKPASGVSEGQDTEIATEGSDISKGISAETIETPTPETQTEAPPPDEGVSTYEAEAQAIKDQILKMQIEFALQMARENGVEIPASSQN